MAPGYRVRLSCGRRYLPSVAFSLMPRGGFNARSRARRPSYQSIGVRYSESGYGSNSVRHTGWEEGLR